MLSFIFLESLSGIILFGLGILFCLSIVFDLVFDYHINKIKKQCNNTREKFKEIAERIPIYYNELKVKTKSWTEEIEVDSFIETTKYEKVIINLNTITLEKTHCGHRFKVEYQIKMDPEILRMKIALQNELSFYYNAKNYDENFLDLNFLPLSRASRS